MTTADFQLISPNLPKQPGVYRFKDETGMVIYVGKAKNLKNRLTSYFGSKKNMVARTRTMVKNADHIEYTIVDTETDALLLENSLIKKLQPRYNVMLKDGKSYSYVCIKKERFPRVFITRKVFRDGSTYFGPYTSKYQIKVLLELIKTLFPLRTCSLPLSEKNILAGKFKVCLEYHIKNCMGPCENLETEAEYNEKVDQIRHILKGNLSIVKQHFRDKMQSFAENLEFEKAGALKEKLDVLEVYQSKSLVVNPSLADLDVFAIASNEKLAFVNYLKIINGSIINTYTQEMVTNLDTDERKLLEFAIPEIRERFNSIAPEILVPFPIEFPDKEVAVTIPKIGDKRKLIDLSSKNVKYYLMNKQKDEATRAKKQTSVERVLKTMQEDLQMDEIPYHIECFDNSNLQGSHPVSSCVVFKNAKPSKADYRHYHVKTVEGPDDFASMEEVVYRRYSRLLREGKSLPQLIIIDGGKGQLSASVKSLVALGILDKVTIVGIAKRLEEIFFPGDSIPLYINKKSESLKIMQQARNEAHRFAITFHRNLRSKGFLGTQLTDIPGVGEKTAERLLQSFASIKKLGEASETEIAEVAGLSVAKKVYAYLHAEEEEE